MIATPRHAEPRILGDRGAGWLADLLAATDVRARRRAQNRYRHREVRDGLETMFQEKCAYCESVITHVSFAHVEHFRPKGVAAYVHLTFVWSNLLLACAVCNSAAWKGDRFPEAADGGPIVDPTAEEPADHLEFVFENGVATVNPITMRGENTEQLLGLNRPDLRIYRTRQIRRLALLALIARSRNDAKQLLRESCLPNGEYAAFARRLWVREFGASTPEHWNQ